MVKNLTVYEKYGMPIWITEFAVADWSAKDQPGTNQYSEEEVLAFSQQATQVATGVGHERRQPLALLARHLVHLVHIERIGLVDARDEPVRIGHVGLELGSQTLLIHQVPEPDAATVGPPGGRNL